MAYQHDRLVLSTNDQQTLEPPISNSTGNIPEGFTYAEVRDDGKNSHWILYPTNDFNESVGVVSIAFIISAGEGKRVFDQGNIRSASVYNDANPGIVIFQHPNFGGNFGEYYKDADITKTTPDKPWVGASSLIVTGGEWELYGRAGKFPGTYIVGQYQNLDPFDDKVHSIKLIKHAAEDSC